VDENTNHTSVDETSAEDRVQRKASIELRYEKSKHRGADKILRKRFKEALKVTTPAGAITIIIYLIWHFIPFGSAPPALGGSRSGHVSHAHDGNGRGDFPTPVNTAKAGTPAGPGYSGHPPRKPPSPRVTISASRSAPAGGATQQQGNPGTGHPGSWPSANPTPEFPPTQPSASPTPTATPAPTSSPPDSPTPAPGSTLASNLLTRLTSGLEGITAALGLTDPDATSHQGQALGPPAG
jgi:hypothetical protein